MNRTQAGRVIFPAACLSILLLAIAPTARASSDLLRAGPMPASMNMRSATIWLQTERDCSAELRWRAGEATEAPQGSRTLTTGPGDGIGIFVLPDLEPGTTYRYEIYLEGERVTRPWEFTFETQPLWQWRTDPPPFTAMIGSCLYVNDPPYDRPGKPYGSDHEILTAMAAADPDLMIWLGDNVYTREVDYYAPEGLAYRYRHDRALPELQAFLASTVHYAIWDDHDYGPNDSDRTYPLKARSLDLLNRYFPAPVRGLPEAPGCFARFRWEDVDFFLLDDRYWRAPDEMPAGSDKRMLGEAQMQWLKEGLASSDGTFKVVALGNQVLNDVGPYETYGRYPEERQEILDWITSRKIEGVLFISGDRHRSELTRVVPEGGYPLYDFTSSPLTAGVAGMKPGDVEWDLPNRVEGTLLLEHSFGLLKFEGPRKERSVTFVACDKSGAVKWERTVRRADLSYR